MSLEIEGVVVRFGGVVAVNGVSLRLEPGHIGAVIGPNGSGKSTLFNAISGLVAIQGGVVRIDGEDAAPLPAHARVRAGLARTFQTPRFDPRITVRTAITCGFYPHLSAGMFRAMVRTPTMRQEECAAAGEYEVIARRLGLAEFSDVPMGELPMGRVRLVEVARAIAAKPRYLLLDEPAAGLTASEQQVLADAIRAEARLGIGVLLVEHNFQLVKNLAEHVVVLNRGTLLAQGAPEAIADSSEVINVYLGGAVEAVA